MPTSIDRVRLKITRAKEHISDLDIKLRRFLNSNPYEVRTKRNPQTRQLIYYLSGVRETPVELSLITGDAVHNLRSALDHLAWQLVIAAGNTPMFGDN